MPLFRRSRSRRERDTVRGVSVRAALAWLPRQVTVTYVAAFVNRSGAMALPFFILYRTEARGDTPAAAAALLGAYGGGALLAGPIGGYACARIGPRRVMVASLVTSAVLVLTVAGWTGGGTAVLVVAWAIATEAFRPASALVIGASVPADRQREAFAGLRLAVNLGMTVGPAAGSFLVGEAPLALFVADAVTSLAAAALLVGTRTSNVALVDGGLAETAKPVRARGKRADVVVHLLATWLVALVAFQAMSTLALYMTRDLHLASSTYGVMFAFSGLLTTVFEVPITFALRARSHRELLACGAALIGAGFGLNAVATSLGGVLASTAVWTVGEMLLGPAAFTRTIELDGSMGRGLVVGFYNAAWSAAFAVGPWVGTYSLTAFGPRLHWGFAAIVGAVAAILFFTAPKRR